MTPIYLTFHDEAAAQAALFADGEPRWPPLQLANPMPMPISRDTGQVDADGAPIYEPVPGWHVNALAPDDLDLGALDAWRVYPATPSVVWALA